LAIAQFDGLEPPVSILVSKKANHKLGLTFETSSGIGSRTGPRTGFSVLFMCEIGIGIFVKTKERLEPKANQSLTGS
jgi:hypothetical protein